MKNPHLGQGEGKDNDSGKAAKRILADSDLCPFAPECRLRWTPALDESGAECGHCHQHLDRETLWRIMERGS
jgi:hypothetical protein